MRKRKQTWLCTLVLLFTLCSLNLSFAQTKADTDTITSRFRTYVLNSAAINDTKVKAYLDSLQLDGSWNDVNYADQSAVNWLPQTHLDRLLSICLSYNNAKSIYYHDATTKAKIYSLFTYWNARGSVSTNWYQNDIAWPLVYGRSLLTMKTGDAFGFSVDTLYTLADVGLNYYDVSAAIYSPTVSESILGSNQTLNLEVSIYKACIKDSTDELRRDFDTAFASIVVIPGTGLGMKVDNSYYQHGSQLYNWGYGTAFLDGVSFFAYYTRNTGFATSQSNIKVLIDYVLDGQQWMQQKNSADFDAIGRGISRSGSLKISGIRSSCLIYLINLNTGYRTKEINNYYKFANGGNVTFQSPGNKYFFKSDFMAHHSSNFYLSVKTPSKRTLGSESLNGENLKAKYLPWGSTNIMINGDEYQNAIPVWDWTRVPGTTGANDPNANFTKMPGNGFRPNNSIAGGVSDGVYGLSVDAFTWDSVSGRKAYFFTPNGMYCMGAGITSTKKGRNIVTSINQCISSGTITVDSAGVQTNYTGQQSTLTNTSWVHHNNVGYLFPNYGKITLANKIQSGSWSSINSNQSSTIVSNTIFSLWVNHDTLPKGGNYEYIVAPYKSVSQFATWASNCPLKKIANNSGFQAFYDDSAKVYSIAFYGAAGVLLDTAKNFYVRTNKAALLLIQKKTNGYSISVADPTQLLDSIGLTTSIKLSGANATVNADSTFISVQLPKGDTAGKTVMADYLLVNPMPINFIEVQSVLRDKKNATISWKVTEEDKVSKYEAEKSIDGKTFSLFKSVIPDKAAKGSYLINDDALTTNNYYRIKAIDVFGGIKYSKVVESKLSIDNYQLTIYPNPLKGNNLNISLANVASGKYVITIFNWLGQKVSEQTITHNGGNGTYSLNMASSLAAANYRVAVNILASGKMVYNTELSVYSFKRAF